MIALLALKAIAFGQATPSCEGDFGAVPDTLSVAWISPVSQRVGAGRSLWVVESLDLRKWLTENPHAGIGRTLQHLGMRKRSKDPKRRYKIAIFEVPKSEICRPLAGYPEGAEESGLAVCDARKSKATSKYTGCGYITDRGDASRSLDVYRVEWRDASRNGFCVIPATRFLKEGRR